MTTEPKGRHSTVLFDIDGTLVDSNDAHTNAWFKAFAESGVPVGRRQIRKAIGMGGDKLMPAVSGIEETSPRGQRISKRRKEIFTTEFLPTLQPFRDAGRLVAALKDRGLTLVAASSATKEELTPLLKVAQADALLDDQTSSDDAEESKPDPDIIQAALKKARASARDAVMVGDTPYDVEAAQRAGVTCIAFRCGGWDDHSLMGAVAIYDGPWDLLAHLDDAPLG